MVNIQHKYSLYIEIYPILWDLYIHSYTGFTATKQRVGINTSV